MNNRKPTPVIVGVIVTVLVFFLFAKMAGISSKQFAYCFAGVSC